jgi:hypothetical protein
LAAAITELALIASGAVITDADAALDKVTTYIEGATNSAKAEQIFTIISDIEIALDKVVTHLTGATRSADVYLDAGDALINTINVGINPATENRLYAGTAISLAEAFIKEGLARAEQMKIQIAKVTGFIQMTRELITEAQIRLAIATTRQGTTAQYIADANGYLRAAEAEVEIAKAYEQDIVNRLARGTGLQAAARLDLDVANRFESEANSRLTDFFNILSDRSKYVTSPTLVSARQYK